MKQRLILTEDETVAVMMALITLNCSFGPGAVWIDYDDEKPLPRDVEFILMKRGILNRNMAGAGI